MGTTIQTHNPIGGRKTDSFVHLHVHSQYSFQASVARIDSLVNQAVSSGMQAMAITDLGNLCGALEFSRTAVKHGIKPILGLDAFLATGSRLDREQGGADNSLVLLAQNDVGFKNLIQLSTAGYTEGFHYRPRIDRQLLADHAAGLICLSGGTLGELTEAVLLEELDQAEKIARWYKGLFGTRYFIELQDHEYQSEHRATRTLIELANKLEIPTVASVSVRYVQRRQAEALDLLSCMLTAKFLSDPDRDLEQQNTFFLQSPQEVQTRWWLDGTVAGVGEWGDGHCNRGRGTNAHG